MTENDVTPILVHDAEFIYIHAACEFVGCSADTVRRWCKLHRIARPSHGNQPLKIHKPALAMLMHNDLRALDLLRRRRYDEERVSRYYDFAGIPLPATAG